MHPYDSKCLSSLSCSHSIRWGTALGVCSRWVSVALVELFWSQSQIIWCNLYPHCILVFPLCFSQTVPGVDGVMKCQPPFSLGPGSASTTSKKSTKMQPRRSSDSKNEAALKRNGKKQGHLHSDHSGAYTKEKVSVHPSADIITEHTLSQASGTFLPLSQVNQNMLYI